MSKKLKRIRAVLQNQQNVDFETVDRIPRDFGFIPKQPRGGSSHYTYRNPETRMKITVAKHKPIHYLTVKELIKLLDLEGWIEHEENS